MGIHVDQGSYALILEYVMGTNLFDFMHKFYMRIPLPKQLMVAMQICDAMAYLHRCTHTHTHTRTSTHTRTHTHTHIYINTYAAFGSCTAI